MTARREELIAVADPDEGRRSAVKRCLDDHQVVLEYRRPQDIGRTASATHFQAIFVAWLWGDPQRLLGLQHVDCTSEVVAPVLLLPRDLAQEQVQAQKAEAETWATRLFPGASVEVVSPFTVHEVHRVSRLLHPPAPNVCEDSLMASSPSSQQASETIDELEAQRLLGGSVQIQRKLDHGANFTVFLGINALKIMLAYKIARTCRERQFEAVKKAIGIIWSTNDGAKYLLPATADYCIDRRFYYVAAALLDNTAGTHFDINTYRPKTPLTWLSSLPRSNGVLGKHDALTLLDYLVCALRGLSFLHGNDLVLNDVHPGNIGFFENRPVWIDYSAITFRGADPHEGAPWYAAPEGREATPAHDCFSLVKVLAESLCGVHPAIIQPMVIEEIAQKYFTGPVSRTVKDIVCKGLAVDPDQRYQSAAELAKDLYQAKRLLAETIV